MLDAGCARRRRTGMFTAWDTVRTLSLEVAKTGTTAREFPLLAAVGMPQ